MGRKKPTDLIFPGANGGPDVHMLRIVKAVATFDPSASQSDEK